MFVIFFVLGMFGQVADQRNSFAEMLAHAISGSLLFTLVVSAIALALWNLFLGIARLFESPKKEDEPPPPIPEVPNHKEPMLFTVREENKNTFSETEESFFAPMIAYVSLTKWRRIGLVISVVGIVVLGLGMIGFGLIEGYDSRYFGSSIRDLFSHDYRWYTHAARMGSIILLIGLFFIFVFERLRKWINFGE